MNKHEQMQAAVTEYRTLCTKDNWTPEDETRAEELKAQIETFKGDIERENRRVESRSNADQFDQFLNKPATQLAHDANANRETRDNDVQRDRAVAQVRRGLKNFRGDGASERAYGFGQFLLATLGGSERSYEYCKKNGIEIRKHQESVNSGGGFLVPTQFDNDLIDLREEFGVFRSLAKNKKMTSDTLVVKRREGGLTAYPVGEGKKIKGSEKKWGEVELKARKVAVLARYTSELNEDAAIDLADDFAGEMAYAFAQYEDSCGFLGDGTSPYHGIVGIIPKLKGLSNNVAQIAGVQVASGNAWSEITGQDMLNLLARCPAYLMKRSPKWFSSTAFYFSVFERLIEEAGGTSRLEMVNGKPTYFYKGFPVELVQTLPSFEENSQVPLIFGDIALAAMFGDRRQSTVAMTSEGVIDGESLFEQEESAIRATQRIDINVHDVGNASADPKLRVAGPVVGLMTAAA